MFQAGEEKVQTTFPVKLHTARVNKKTEKRVWYSKQMILNQIRLKK